MPIFERKKVGVALGSGGARGIAHIGVLKVLEEEKIPIDFISGTSMGAVIAALYSAEPNAKKLEKEFLNEEYKKLFDYTFPRYGLIKGEKIEKMLQERLNNITFKDLKIPLFITSFDIEKNREIIFSRGSVARAVRASMSIPGVFIPVRNKGEILVDGGVIDPIPTEILKKQGAEIIIAVNVENFKERLPLYNEEAVSSGSKKLPNILESASRSLQVTSAESCKLELAKSKADLIINVNLENLGTLDFSMVNAEKAIKAGHMTAKKNLKKIKQLTEPNPFKLFLDELQTSMKNRHK